MIAKYRGIKFYATITDDEVNVITHIPDKKLNNFESQRDYFIKITNLEDPELELLYDIHFYIEYHDTSSKETIWCLDEGLYVSPITNIENDYLVIGSNYFDKIDENWQVYDKGLYSKIIKPENCKKFFIEKIFYNRDSSTYKQNVVVNYDEFKRIMIESKSKNL